MSRNAAEWQERPNFPETHYVSTDIYTDEQIFKEEQERIFNKCWIIACHESELVSAYDYRTFHHPGGAPLIVIRGEDQFVRSDQYPFIRAGIPAIVVRPGALSSDPAVDAKAVQRKFRLNDYHMPSDTTALPIHWPSIARQAQVTIRLTRLVADADARPEWLPGDFFGRTFGSARRADVG